MGVGPGTIVKIYYLKPNLVDGRIDSSEVPILQVKVRA